MAAPDTYKVFLTAPTIRSIRLSFYEIIRQIGLLIIRRDPLESGCNVSTTRSSAAAPLIYIAFGSRLNTGSHQHLPANEKEFTVALVNPCPLLRPTKSAPCTATISLIPDRHFRRTSDVSSCISQQHEAHPMSGAGARGPMSSAYLASR
jgi:hypothetical protein